MSALSHWISTNPAQQPTPPPANDARGRGDYHHGPKAKPIVYGGVTYWKWADACAATGMTKDQIRWAIRSGKS